MGKRKIEHIFLTVRFKKLKPMAACSTGLIAKVFKKIKYSQLSLRRTPLEPALSVRLREVSVKRESTVIIIIIIIMIIIIIINIALFSYSFIALYNDCANVKTKKNTEKN